MMAVIIGAEYSQRGLEAELGTSTLNKMRVKGGCQRWIGRKPDISKGRHLKTLIALELTSDTNEASKYECLGRCFVAWEGDMIPKVWQMGLAERDIE